MTTVYENETITTSAPAMEAKQPRPKVLPFRLIRETLSTVAFVIAVFTLLQLAIPRSVVEGRSMQPTLQTGQRLVISRVNYLVSPPQYGDIIVFNSPAPLRDNEPPLIKRVIGLPGDTIEIRDLQVYRNGEQLDEPYINEVCRSNKCPDNTWVLGSDEYFMMGDNRNHSRDSREFGPVPGGNIVGEALIRFWPLTDIGIIHRSAYPTN